MTVRANVSVSLNSTVAAVLRRCPDAIAVFTRHRMACPGCVFAPFDTLADAADAYGLERKSLLREIAGSCASARNPGRETRTRRVAGRPSRDQQARKTRR